MALQPLIADPNDPMQGTLPPQLPKGLGDTLPPQGGGLPSLGALPPLPSSGGLSSGLKPIVQNPRQKQEQALQEKISSFENPAKPQGFWQKLGHALAQNPYSTAYRNTMERGRVNELAGLQQADVQEQDAASKRTLEGEQGTEAAARAAQTEEITKELPGKTKSEEELQAAETAGSSPDLATYRSLVGMGMSPSAALKEVEHDKALALKPPNAEHVAFQDSKGNQMMGSYDPMTRQFTDTWGKVIPDAKPIPPPAAVGAVTVIEPSGKVDRLTPGQIAKPGSVTPGGLSSENVPTAATRTMSETAPKVIELANRSEQLIDQQINTLGPAASRWQEFMAGKVGAPNPEFTKLRTDIGLLQTALMRMHVGARGGEKIMEHFTDLIDASKQDPQNLKAALEEIKAYADEVGKGGGQGTADETAKAEGKGAPAVGTVEGGFKFKGGDASKQENWEQVKK